MLVWIDAHIFGIAQHLVGEERIEQEFLRALQVRNDLHQDIGVVNRDQAETDHVYMLRVCMDDAEMRTDQQGNCRDRQHGEAEYKVAEFHVGS
jgi:hypothetical protein